MSIYEKELEKQEVQYIKAVNKFYEAAAEAQKDLSGSVKEVCVFVDKYDSAMYDYRPLCSYITTVKFTDMHLYMLAKLLFRDEAERKEVLDKLEFKESQEVTQVAIPETWAELFKALLKAEMYRARIEFVKQAIERKQKCDTQT